LPWLLGRQCEKDRQNPSNNDHDREAEELVYEGTPVVQYYYCPEAEMSGTEE